MRITCLVLFLFLVVSGSAQKSYQIKKISTPILVDGQLDEAAWSETTFSGEFFQNFPTDTIPAVLDTRIKMAYDDNHLYIAAICNKKADSKNIITSLKRDFDGESDVFETYISPFKDGTNGFLFGLNPYGVQREGLISSGSSVDFGWDNTWFSEVSQESNQWVVEMAIPFKTLRFKKGESQWHINFGRRDLTVNETSSWIPVPINYDLQNLGFCGDLVWEAPLKQSGPNISIIPYVSGKASKDYEKDKAAQLSGSIGGDAKIALNSSLNLDITINPDFSQVEVDQQVTNLDRFELFFPERRQFFLENNDLFSNFGFSKIRPVFTRRIGVARDTANDTYVQNNIYYGLRLNGKINNNWRTSILNAQTAKNDSINLKSTNFTSAVINRKVFDRSDIGLILVNKQVTFNDKGELSLKSNEYNRVGGAQYSLRSKDNKWNGKSFVLYSLSPEKSKDSYAHATWLYRNTKHWNIMWNHEYVGDNYDAEVGYTPRTGIWRLEPMVNYTFYPKGDSKIANHGIEVYTNLYTDNEITTLLDRKIVVGKFFNLKNTSSFELFVNSNYIYLTSSFDPTNTGGVELPDSTVYPFYDAWIGYQSDLRKKFVATIGSNFGQFYNGEKIGLEGNVSYRIQPYGSIGVKYSAYRIMLPAPYSTKNLVLLGPAVDWAFSRKVFLKGVVQYNNQINNINTNIRFQWRFRPVSDLYIVYNENYTDRYGIKNRSIVLKFIYWLNV